MNDAAYQTEIGLNLTDEIESSLRHGERAMRRSGPGQWKLQLLRETICSQMADTPQTIANYFRANITNEAAFNPEVESFYVILLTARKTVKGHVLVSTGLADSVVVHSREVFRVAIVGSAHAIILVHNHPSGDATPSEADTVVTRSLIRAGQLLKIEVLDRIIIGNPGFKSLRELGYFYQS